jgi:hypothetical protein
MASGAALTVQFCSAVARPAQRGMNLIGDVYQRILNRKVPRLSTGNCA